MKKIYFVTAIGTGVGKTLISALICEYLRGDYFKPIQTGYPPDKDSEKVKSYVSYFIRTHPENYLLKMPVSPHLAAKREGIEISLDNIHLPPAENHLIIEGAGGLLVPLNGEHCIADLIIHLNAECILVVSDYLGTINHSLLSLYYIQQKKIPFKGMVLNGNFETEVRDVIVKCMGEQPIISEIPFFEPIENYTFQEIYETFKKNMKIKL